MSELATAASVIKKGIYNALKDVHTSMPGIIVSFDAVTQTASVQPAIKRIFKELKADSSEILAPADLPVLINVPIQFPRGGGFSITLPVEQGDECLLVFCERTIDGWHERGGVQLPTAKRFFSLSDATAFVGISSVPNKVPDYNPNDMVLKKDGAEVFVRLRDTNRLDIHADSIIEVTTNSNVNVTAGGNVSVQASGQVDVTAPTINLNGAVNINGNTSITGTLTNNGANVGSTHTHQQAADSAGNSQQNVGAPQ